MERKIRKKKFKFPTKEEYYAGFANMNIDGPYPHEKCRSVVKKLKEHPIPYEMFKKAMTGR